MATSLSALLNIKANVTGEGAVAGLGKAIGGLKGAAGQASGGLEGLTKAAGAGGLGSALGTLTPLLSGAGLMAFGKSAIDAADDMNDLAQKTGVSVESLSKFQQAANASGTDIEGVGKAMLNLNKGLGQLAREGKGPVADALKALGVSAYDARGKMLSTDEIMLRVADKFKKLPDGAKKTEIAFALFSKAGADMIPMLNGGRASIEGLSSTMSTKFAKAADAANDKMATLQAKIGEIGVKLGESLLPTFEKITDKVIEMVDAFGRLTPQQQQIVGTVVALAIGFALLAPTISAVVSLVGGLVGFITGGAGLVGAFTAVGAAIAGVGPFFTGLAAVVAGFITWPVLLVAALVAAAVAIFVFRDKIAAFFENIQWLIGSWIEMLWEWAEPIRAFWVSVWDGLRDIVPKALQLMIAFVGEAFGKMIDLLYQLFIEPWVKAWEGLKIVAAKVVDWLRDIWSGYSEWVGGIFKTIGNAWNSLMQLLPKAMKSAADVVKNVWQGVIDTIKAIVNGAMNAIGGALNAVIEKINDVIVGFNKLPGPDIGLIPKVTIPKFAEGGYITGPTLGLVGEAGREYIVPEGKAAGFAANYLGGARGAAAIPTTSSGATGGGPAGPVQVNLTTGPIMQTADGPRSVSLEEVERLVRDGVGQTIRQLRTPAGRYAMGVR
jgi:phage-related protein